MPSARDEPRFWTQLLQFVEDERVVPIVGQDLLTVRVDGRAVHLYAHLAERLAADLDVDADGLPAGGELNAVATRYLARPRTDVEDIYSSLKSIWPAADRLTVPAPLAKLAGIGPFKLFVTTTFDPLLERALNEARFGGEATTEVLAYSPEEAADLAADRGRLPRPTVFHLFGRLSAVPDYAVTEEDTLEFVHALQSENRRPRRLFGELSRSQLLIIGCSFPGWLARFFIRAAAGARLSVARGKSFVADAAVRDDPQLVQFLSSFSTRTRVFAGGGAVEFVDELHERWTAAHGSEPVAPPPPEPPRVVPGSVFLSYASEDVEAARAICQELERTGVDVWFDEGLERGHDWEAEIRWGIENCSVFLPVISAQTLTRERRFFRVEWTLAERVAEMVPPAQKFILPVAIDDTSPRERAIPEGFRRLQWDRLPGKRLADDPPPPELGALVGEVRRLFREHHRARKVGR